ncbi:amino acid deaminase [Salinibacterium sp. NSLL150]|uniref:amino acid deaminase n=1 Tax=unclassified Salinibacterium TaxID=2632331 RepID=UPI0018CD0C01|nr:MULTISPECIES: amino acid deaminase [unclassified Salinibacterium]MBH0097963.1 amino acid deaminase [Salinibacterium sp. NSLL35]MBH0100718.1 amino acid deaminase [Salinibacterium sp. NSLL150]MBH0103477.1 amino acid deaminase [Salinibacterium sp. NSLL16]MBH0106238.1 amino acid deaminase [Salinibacterium sp. NSLL17]
MDEQHFTLAELDASARRIAAVTGERAVSRARIHTIITGELPWLADQIGADRAEGRFAEWALSTAIDENTGEAVVSRELFEVLHDLAGLEAQWPIGNAGLLHCYGYLLSTASTPYGLKRDRWVTSELATAFGLAPDAFTPWTGSESLLSRVAHVIVPTLTNPPADALAVHTAITEPDAAGVSHATRTVVVQRHGVAALAYGFVVQHAGVRVLRPVTVFPVSASSDWLAELAADVSRLRFNAVGAG